MIEIRNVSYSYGEKNVLNNVDLILKEGSVMGLVGINGAGKTTLLRLVSGVYTPGEGQVLVDGVSNADPSTREKIFFLPDDPYFTSHTTGKSLFEMYKVFYPAIDKGVFERQMEIFKLDEKKPIRNFSKGMRRQLFVALALAVKPKYLLLDEAFDGLDPLARLEFKKAVNDAVEENGMAVIISSHSLRELEDFCDSYALIDKTTVSSSGDIAERVNSFCKFQLAFAEEKGEEIFRNLPVVAVERSGRFFRVVLSGDAEKMYSELEGLSPLIVEQMNMDFEEMFIHEVERRREKR